MGVFSRGKDPRRIEKIAKEFDRNHRLSWAFSICQDLGIDDPISWMNACPVLLDWWIGYRIHKSEREREAYEKASGKSKTKLSGDSLYDHLEQLADGRKPSRGSILRSDTRP